MTATHHHRTWLALPLTLALLPSLTACASDAKPASQPSLTTTPTPDASNTTDLSDREQIEALYTDFIVRFPDAQDLEKSERREYLAQWLVDPLLARYVKDINEQTREHQRYVGTGKPDVRSVMLKRTTATLDDCLDDSSTYLKDERTGKILARGSKQPVWVATR